MAKKEVKDCGLTFKAFEEMSPTEKAKHEESYSFNYKTIDEYVEDIVIWLCDNYNDTEKTARNIIRMHYNWGEEDFANHVPVDLCAADVGYCCG